MPFKFDGENMAALYPRSALNITIKKFELENIERGVNKYERKQQVKRRRVHY